MTEKLKIPTKVVDSDWKDDVVADDIGVDYETYGTNKQEMEYVAPSEIPKESIAKIKAMNLKRGRNTLSIFSKNEKLAA